MLVSGSVMNLKFFGCFFFLGGGVTHLEMYFISLVLHSTNRDPRFLFLGEGVAPFSLQKWIGWKKCMILWQLQEVVSFDLNMGFMGLEMQAGMQSIGPIFCKIFRLCFWYLNW